MKILGCVNGCNVALLYNGRKLLGECNFTPNAIALAMKQNHSITRAVEASDFMPGVYTRADLRDRFSWIAPTFDAGIKFYNK